MAEEREGKDITSQDPVISGTNSKNEETQSINELETVIPSLDVKQQCSDGVTTPGNDAHTINCGEAMGRVVNAGGDHLQNDDLAKRESHGGCKGDSTKDEDTPESIPEENSCPSGEDPINNKEETFQTPARGEEEEEVDGLKAEISEKSPAAKDTNSEAEKAGGDHLQNDDLAKRESHGGCKGDSTKDEDTPESIPEENSCPSGEDPINNKEETFQTPARGEEEEEVDGLKAEISEKSPAAKDTNSEAEKDGLNASASEKEINKQKNRVFPQIQKVPDVKDNSVETIGPNIIKAFFSAIPVTKIIYKGLPMCIVIVFIAILIAVLQPQSPPPKKDLCQIDIFLKEMEKVKTQYPNQRSELWKRSRIHLKKHLLTSQPTEPVSLILTAGLSAERTLHCLAQSLAHAFSSALNTSYLQFDGASKARQDSDQVKLDIDSKLQGAFEGDKPVAVIHRFEELPPGSTLIFYRYCDHENAAYKNTFLIFTVLLGEEEEIPAETRLSAVEEMVDDHLQKRFLSRGLPASFDRMDLDKYGGLWSRISHLILPVAAEKRKEHEGC